ncbi:hypothetical protein ACROYT_G005232 [Oculina patagonica]
MQWNIDTVEQNTVAQGNDGTMEQFHSGTVAKGKRGRVNRGVCRNCRILLSKLDCEAESGKAPAEKLSDETVLVPMDNLTIASR